MKYTHGLCTLRGGGELRYRSYTCQFGDDVSDSGDYTDLLMLYPSFVTSFSEG